MEFLLRNEILQIVDIEKENEKCHLRSSEILFTPRVYRMENNYFFPYLHKFSLSILSSIIFLNQSLFSLATRAPNASHVSHKYSHSEISLYSYELCNLFNLPSFLQNAKLLFPPFHFTGTSVFPIIANYKSGWLRIIKLKFCISTYLIL